MQKVPLEWIDRLFFRLHEIYGESWSRMYGDEKKKHLYYAQWQSALIGLSGKDIADHIERLRKQPKKNAPTCLDFYHGAKGKVEVPKPTEYLPPVQSTPEVAKMNLDEIKSKLKYCI